MAEEQYVRMEQFGEFVKRVEERFDHANELATQRYDSLNQRLADAEKAREQNLLHVDQRFESVAQRFESVDQRFESIAQRFESVNQHFANLEKRFDDLRTMLVVMYTPIALAILGAVVKILFFSK